MNFDHLNKIHDFWRNDIFPYLRNLYLTPSFNEYIKDFSFLSSGKWLKDMDKANGSKIIFMVDANKFIKKYKNSCVTYMSIDKITHIIYQISPTLHIDATLLIYIEHNKLYSYLSLFACYSNEKEFLDFVDELYSTMRMEGNTEDRSNIAGFAGY